MNGCHAQKPADLKKGLLVCETWPSKETRRPKGAQARVQSSPLDIVKKPGLHLLSE